MTQTATFVDLAGSERVGKSGATGAALAQATSINQSLTTLGMVVQALASNKPHVPYRESKLTKLLKGQLEGRAKIAVCICVADGAEHAEESVCSLRFGKRCRAVANDAAEERADIRSGREGGGARTLERVKAELEDLEMRGFGETFGADAAESEIKSYRANCYKLAECERKLRNAQGLLFEERAKAKREGGGTPAVEGRVIELKKDVVNLGDIILRQKSIKGFVRPPSSLWTKKFAEVRELEQMYS